MYPPEVVVIVTPNVSQATRELLCPVYCTRILEVEPISFPSKSLENNQVTSHVQSWSEQGALTKLHIFRLENYDTLLYIDADCLVVKEVTSLLELGKIYHKSEALIAAAADILPPDKFNAGVLVIRPSEAVFKNMMEQRSLLTAYDGGDTGFLNAYFSNWYTDMPPFARLPFGYNAQRFLHHCTYAKQPNYWDLSVAPNLHIIHYSSSPKPWESKPTPSAEGPACDHLPYEDLQTLQRVSKSAELESLWWKWYGKSQNYYKVVHDRARSKNKSSTAHVPKKPATNPMAVHKQVAARYKALRRMGKTTKEAMSLSRQEYGLDDNPVDARSAVAAMFGMGGM